MKTNYAFMHNGRKYITVYGCETIQEEYPDVFVLPVSDIIGKRVMEAEIAQTSGGSDLFELPMLEDIQVVTENPLVVKGTLTVNGESIEVTTDATGNLQNTPEPVVPEPVVAPTNEPTTVPTNENEPTVVPTNTNESTKGKSYITREPSSPVLLIGHVGVGKVHNLVTQAMKAGVMVDIPPVKVEEPVIPTQIEVTSYVPVQPKAFTITPVAEKEEVQNTYLDEEEELLDDSDIVPDEIEEIEDIEDVGCVLDGPIPLVAPTVSFTHPAYTENFWMYIIPELTKPGDTYVANVDIDVIKNMSAEELISEGWSQCVCWLFVDSMRDLRRYFYRPDTKECFSAEFSRVRKWGALLNDSTADK